MTAPTITYGHGYLTDCDDATGWVKTENGQTLAAISVDYNDVFTIEATGSAGAKIGYYSYPDEGGASNINIASNTYQKAVFRYKTSDSSIKAKIALVFSDASTQSVLSESSSTTWASGSADITGSKIIDHIRLHTNKAVGYVYYDFALLTRNIFTFPQFANVSMLGPKKTVELDILCKDAGNIQHLGMKSPLIQLEGMMDTATGWGTPDGEYLYYLLRDHDRWQWFTSDVINCKVVVDSDGFRIGQDSSVTAQRVWSLPLKLYSQSSLGEDYWDGKQWFGQ